MEAWANGKTTASGCESADFILFASLTLSPSTNGMMANGKTYASGSESADYYFIFPTNRRRGSSGRMSQGKDNLTRVLIS